MHLMYSIQHQLMFSILLFTRPFLVYNLKLVNVLSAVLWRKLVVSNNSLGTCTATCSGCKACIGWSQILECRKSHNLISRYLSTFLLIPSMLKQMLSSIVSCKLLYVIAKHSFIPGVGIEISIGINRGQCQAMLSDYMTTNGNEFPWKIGQSVLFIY